MHDVIHGRSSTLQSKSETHPAVGNAPEKQENCFVIFPLEAVVQVVLWTYPTNFLQTQRVPMGHDVLHSKAAMKAPVLVTHHRSFVTTVKARHLPLIQLGGQKWHNWKMVKDEGLDVRNAHLTPSFKERFLGNHRLTITTTFTITSDQFSSSWRLGLNQPTIILQDPSVRELNHKPTALSRLIFAPMTVSYIQISLPTSSISALYLDDMISTT